MNDKISSIKIDGVGYEIQDLEAKTRIDEIENSYVKATDTVEEVTSIEETLVTNALRKTVQTLTAAEKSQVQKNIGVDGLSNAITSERERAMKEEEKLNNSLLAQGTVRFDRIVEEEITINTGSSTSIREVVYSKHYNKFVAFDGSSYWDTWDDMEAYMSGGKVREDKVYLCDGTVYIFDGRSLSIDKAINETKSLLESRINNLGLPLGYTLIDTYESTDYNISRKLHLNIEAGAELKIKIELSEPLRREDDEMYIFLRDSDGITINYIGEIKSGEQSKEKTIEFSRSYKNAYIIYSLAYSKDYTITTTIERINTLQQQLSKVNNEVAELNRDITNINASLKEYKALEKIETKIGFIAANGTLNNTVTYLSVDYYNVAQGELWYKASSEVPSGLEGVYLIHFFDASSGYLGHSDAIDISIKDYVFSVPEETSVITITRWGNKKSSLSVLMETSEGITERVVSLEKSLLLKKKSIVAFGDSITAMTDDDGMSYIDYVSEITGATAYNAGIPGSRLSISEECVFIKIKSKATADGEVTVNGAVRSVSFTALATDSMEDLAAKLFNAYKSLSSTLAYNVNGNEVTVRNWSGFTAPINVNNIVCETNTGVTIEVRKNKYGMFESFTSTYMAYSNLDIPHMVYGLISNDWRCQMLAAEYLASQNVTGMVEKISALQALSINDIDIVTIAGGTNNYAADWGANDSNNTAYLSGGINEIIQMLLSAKPTLRVAFFTPIPRYFGSSIANWDDSMWGDNYVKNEHNGVMPALVEKISEVVKRNHIPIHDMYYSIGWNRWNFAQFFKDSDGTHPMKGLRWMGERIAKYVIQ